MNVSIAQSIADIKKCFPVIVQLRTTLSIEKFQESVSRQQKSGYQLAFIEDNGMVVAVVGFRISECLSWGKFLYIDDLITDSENRSKGYGDKIIDFLVEYAKKENCKEFHLDSGVERFDAHRFYMRNRMNIVAHHFAFIL